MVAKSESPVDRWSASHDFSAFNFQPSFRWWIGFLPPPSTVYGLSAPPCAVEAIIFTQLFRGSEEAQGCYDGVLESMNCLMLNVAPWKRSGWWLWDVVGWRKDPLGDVVFWGRQGMAIWVNFRGFGGKHVSFFCELWEDVGEDDFFLDTAGWFWRLRALTSWFERVLKGGAGTLKQCWFHCCWS